MPRGELRCSQTENHLLGALRATGMPMEERVLPLEEGLLRTIEPFDQLLRSG